MSSWPEGPVPQCPADKQICPAGCYCSRVFEDRVGVCLPPPPNCGQENARCCPPGIYGPPGSPRNVTGFSCEGKDIKCPGWGGMPGAGVCTLWPSPPDCGLPGIKCCLDPYHAWMDSSEPPPVCQGGPKGSYCEGPYNNGTCKENPADCGQLGKACCRSLSGCCSNYTCGSGLYCPFMDESEPTCKACPTADEAQKQGKELPWECQPPASNGAATDGGN
ncbi:cadherin EGF LAG seven-pass G-type receptor 3 [Chlorella sorokiniana]|uniref:Cadherin EGF LAG seven-pass G-type receptor 3 n=1 Tax=Chlorella sorokiniana TaxID=3076 RepID=A0A2P6U2T5_CHLSO|nr:cadherin EGF LAG seven-pass G-type receptor 3 [Chlorella sorokiniana]|eukprot:PRW60625.1 cadherin EGF LAG seven-pass G-type receptor 3 [Chlorella sorokiniana]